MGKGQNATGPIRLLAITIILLLIKLQEIFTMLNKENSQSVSNNKNSTINQAARDIVINGLQPCDVVQIVNTIVASKLAEYAANAQLTARERLDAFEEKLLEEVS